ncbi:MAG TPA: carbohydrate kinase family protein [Bryobacteraceae bacterium]|nr:carbohydrate kinase family protein [Bryobacteraceae bacterium]
MKKAIRILVAGELNPDFILSGYTSFPCPGQEVLVDNAVLTLGSSSAICAAGLAKLGNAVSFAGLVGQDAWGEFCLHELQTAGVDTSRVIQSPAVKTGITVSLTAKSDRALVTYAGAIEKFRLSDIDLGDLDQFQHLHISSYFLQTGLRGDCRELFAAARRKGLTTSLDPGCDPAGEWGKDLLETLEEVDIFLPNEVELRGITRCEDPIAGLRALEDRRAMVVAKLGVSGSMLLEHGRLVRVPSFRVDAIDTTGAGDSFNAGFLHAWLRKASRVDALKWGAACGALATLGYGGTASQPRGDAVESFLHAISVFAGD